jgi:endonuclease III
MSVDEVVRILREYNVRLETENTKKEVDFVGVGDDARWTKAKRLLLKNGFAFLLGVIYDQSQKAEVAWRYPYLLQKSLGHLEPKMIAAITLTDLDNSFMNTQPRLRYWRMASARTLRAAEMVCTKYDSDAHQIWLKDSPSPREMQRRFDEFDGIAQKKASMATNILIRDLRWVTVEDRSEIDVSYDRHVRRVFLRAGLVDADNQDVIVHKARALAPDYPGALDLPAWIIGRNFCSNDSPQCGSCRLSTPCGKRTEFTVR